ncbi:MAG: 50S ribosomal protein L25 [Ignavibacteriota bacterium]|jgi:large subunit ribosomal protein L25|nr:MAG: 50S ribosomal protein L25 [Chlorobiota bacterium]MBE7476389.1 50S ribosomal protein L25 [Ignavibacteriales bacterium]MBL1124372.1 50S ribosomal protein L25 [Ignavibacteriota bacterium]MBV6420697.1 50S ribosomal protein L25 [Ignavibacteriaceae bacterium]MCE7855457.1 50S ribosomal protein L25 [Ignavibacteria bacterium CHB3]MEB2295502.1 50S ribosomal protein L25 [Ignavibacteria bacterium]
MEKKILKASERNVFNKSGRRRFRREGSIPGVFYSKNIKPLHINVADKAINPLVFTSKTHLISLELEGHEEYECIIKDVQFDPVTDRVIHFDLLGLTKGEKIKLAIPVQLVGSPIGVKEGGIIQHVMYKVEVECLPRNIPEHIVIDISGLKLNDSIHIGDLKFENIEFTDPKESLVVQVTHAKIKEEAAPAAEGAVEEPKEPEVISKGKQEEKEEE